MALDRLRSFSLAAPAREPPVTGVVDLGSDELLPPLEMEDAGCGGWLGGGRGCLLADR
jgi:hypothetical protein